MGHSHLCVRENHTILDGKSICSLVQHNLIFLATPTNKFGSDLPPGVGPTPRDVPHKDDWYPFTSRIEFETAEFLFTENQMPQGHVDRLMQLWTASMLHHNDRAPYSGHADLHHVIDAIPHGDVPWKSFQVHYSGNLPEPVAPSWMTKGYDIWFHDPNTVVKNLLSNPDFHGHFDYTPYCEFELTGQRCWENSMLVSCTKQVWYSEHGR